MKKKYIFFTLIVLAIISGCEKNSDKAENNEQTSQNISQSKEEETTEKTQESEYSAEKTNATLAEMGIKSYDIWSYLRLETGEETDSFLNKEYETVVLSDGIEYAEEKDEFIEKRRKLIYGRYKIEQQEPLIIKVNCKNDDFTAYLSEKEWQEKAYAYVSPNGYLFKNNEKWYEIQGYNDYKECTWLIRDFMWMYSGKTQKGEFYTLTNHMRGFDKRDEKSYDEEKIRKDIQEYLYGEKDIPEEAKDKYIYRNGQCTYNCGELTVNAFYRVDEATFENYQTVSIRFYVMLDEYKSIECSFYGYDSKDYYNEITEEMLREIFTVREYK